MRRLRRLDALDEREGAVGRDRGTDVAQQLHARLDDVGDAVAEHVGVAGAVVARVGLGESGELLDVLRPLELAAVDDDAADDRAVAAEELGGRVHDDVGTVLERTDEVRGRDRVVDDERHVVLVRDVGDERDVEHVDLRVADGLGEEQLGVGAHGGGPLVGVVLVFDEGDLDAELRERVLEEVVGAAVDRGRRDDVVARLRDVEHRVGDRRLSRRPRASAAVPPSSAATRCSTTSLVGFMDARVDVAELGEREEVLGVLGVVEHVRRGLVDRRRAGVGGRVGLRLRRGSAWFRTSSRSWFAPRSGLRADVPAPRERYVGAVRAAIAGATGRHIVDGLTRETTHARVVACHPSVSSSSARSPSAGPCTGTRCGCSPRRSTSTSGPTSRWAALYGAIKRLAAEDLIEVDRVEREGNYPERQVFAHHGGRAATRCARIRREALDRARPGARPGRPRVSPPRPRRPRRPRATSCASVATASPRRLDEARTHRERIRQYLTSPSGSPPSTASTACEANSPGTKSCSPPCPTSSATTNEVQKRTDR